MIDLVCVFAGACSALPGFQPTLTGGNGASVPLCECLAIYEQWGAYSRISSFRWVLAPAELCDRLSPGDRSESIVSVAVTEKTED